MQLSIDESLFETLKEKNKIRLDIDKDIGLIDSVSPILSDDFIFFHIEELTFEDESPRKEALDNVLSSLRIEGINLLYLLLGDKKGVSFYFGIVKDKKYQKKFPLSVSDIGKYILKSNLEGNFRGSKIVEVDKSKVSILHQLNSMSNCSRVDGVAGINVDNENFQGVDRLVDVMMGDEFAMMVLANPLSAYALEDIENSLYDLHNKLIPLAKKSLQKSKGKTETVGISEGKNSSDTKGTNEGDSDAISSGKSKGTSTDISESKNSDKSSSSTSNGGNESSSNNRTVTTNKGKNTSSTIGVSYTENKSTTENESLTESNEFSDKAVNEWIEYIDEVLLKRLDYGRSNGLFNVGTYLFAHNKGTLFKLGNTIKSLFSGTEDNQVPLRAKYIKEGKELQAVKNLQLPSFSLIKKKDIDKLKPFFSKYGNSISSWVSTKELSIMIGLPQKEVVGLPLKEEVEFGLNIRKQNIKNEDKILLGNLVRSGLSMDIEVEVDKNNLNKHTFITGVTGSGKTTTCQRILKSSNMPFLVIEPAKTEYRILMQKNKNMLVFTLGDESIAPFRINPFEFFKGEKITSRVDMIKANIEAAFDMEAAIPQMIESALYECYESYGWDIATSTNSEYKDPFANGIYSFPTLEDLLKQTKLVVEAQGFDDRLQKDYIGSINARLQGLLIGSKGFMLNTSRSIDFINLLEKDVVLELEEIKSGTEKSLIMGFILINLNEAIKIKYKEYREKGKNFKHITLIEEAHRLLSKYIAGDNPSKKLGVETFSDMLAEVRKYGESLIIVDQIPDKLTPEVLKNTNTKIVHKLFASDDKNAIGNTMALNDEQKEFLSNLEVGRAIVSNQDFPKPLQVQIKELEDVSTTNSDLIDEKHIRKQALLYYQKNYKRGVIQGLEIYEDEPSLEKIEELLSLKISGLLRGWRELCKLKNMNDKFVFDIQKYLEEKKLTKDIEFLSYYLLNKFYSNSKKKETIIVYLIEFLQKVIEGQDEFSSDEKTYLRIR